MNYNNPILEKTAGIVRYSCGFLFLAFCFCYLYFLQGDVLAEVQYVYSGGLTHYSLLGGAVIITLVLQLLQWVLRFFIHLPDRFYALTYVPSFIGLAMITSLDSNVEGTWVWGAWKWLLPLLLILWVLVVLVIKRIDDLSEKTHLSVPSLMWPNFLTLFAFICLCSAASSTSSAEMSELKVERLLSEKDYETAAGVGLRSLETTPRLSYLRMYALSKQGLLADSMFSYPQYYGTKGLIDITDTSTSCRFPMQNIELSLGAFAGTTIHTSQRFLERLQEDSVATEQGRQYLLCYYLLDRNLNRFNKVLTTIYGDTITSVLPRAYQEAVVMQHPEYRVDSLPIYINKVYVEGYHAYMAMKDSLGNTSAMKNITRRMYGNTYWWYYDNTILVLR